MQLFSKDVYQQREERTKGFRDARFGMFIHCGVYAIPAHPILDKLGRPNPWEACITLNNDWGYSA